jgi:hypothetical protein
MGYSPPCRRSANMASAPNLMFANPTNRWPWPLEICQPTLLNHARPGRQMIPAAPGRRSTDGHGSYFSGLNPANPARSWLVPGRCFTETDHENNARTTRPSDRAWYRNAAGYSRLPTYGPAPTPPMTTAVGRFRAIANQQLTALKDRTCAAKGHPHGFAVTVSSVCSHT